MSDLNARYDTRAELDLLSEKLETLKNDYKKLKEIGRQKEIKLKEQSQLTRALEEKCKMMEIKIEKAKQKQKNKEIDNFLVKEDDISTLETKIISIQTQNKLLEKNYKDELFKQQELITKINEKIIIIGNKIKEKEQEIRINEFNKRKKIILEPRATSASKK